MRVAFGDLNCAVAKNVTELLDWATVPHPVGGECMPRRLIPGQARKPQLLPGGVQRVSQPMRLDEVPMPWLRASSRVTMAACSLADLAGNQAPVVRAPRGACQRLLEPPWCVPSIKRPAGSSGICFVWSFPYWPPGPGSRDGVWVGAADIG